MSLPFRERTIGPVQISPSHPEKRSMLLSVVIPCMNEEEVLRETNRRLVAVLEGISLNFEIVYVDDGSTDATPELLGELQAHDSRIRVVRFSRNFGHQVAITAGLEHASGDAVPMIDAELQEPPDVSLDFAAKWLAACGVAGRVS